MAAKPDPPGTDKVSASVFAFLAGGGAVWWQAATHHPGTAIVFGIVAAIAGYAVGTFLKVASRSQDVAADRIYRRCPPISAGTRGRSRRWHKELETRAGTATIVALEAIRVDNRTGVLLVHLLPGDILGTARELAGRQGCTLNGFDVRQLAPELGIAAPPYTLAFTTPARRFPRLYSLWRYPRWPAFDQWLWALASRTNENDYPPDPAGIRSHAQDRTFFRHRLWWQHLTPRGIPNQILTAFHRQHQLSERFGQILAEVSDYSRLAHDDQARDVSNSTVLFTVITVPAGIGLAVLQVLGHPSSGEFILVIAACLAASLLVLLTRPGRLAIRSVRKRFSLAR